MLGGVYRGVGRRIQQRGALQALRCAAWSAAYKEFLIIRICFEFIRLRQNTLQFVVAKRKSRLRGRRDDQPSPKASARQDGEVNRAEAR